MNRAASPAAQSFECYDSAVIGAGPAGAVAAWVLARAGRRVLLIDSCARRTRKVGESLPAAARPLLAHLGLAAVVEGDAHLPCYGNASAWGSDYLACSDFLFDPHGLGWHLDRPRFDLALRDAACDGGARFALGRARLLGPTPEGWRIDVAGKGVEARWIVDATGRPATLARAHGAARKKDDQLLALCAWMQPAPGDADGRTLIEATAHGWWYSARLPGELRVVVFHADAAEAARILRSPGAWERELAATAHLAPLLAGARLVSGPRGAEACGARLDRFSGRGWIAAGDAALSFDPLSSQGIFNALYSGMRAGEAVDCSLGGREGALQQYSARLEEIRAAYLARRREVYAAEQRWPKAPFWQRRRRALAVA